MLGKKVGNLNEIFFEMMGRVRFMVSSFVYISHISGVIGKSEFILSMKTPMCVSLKPIAIDLSVKSTRIKLVDIFRIDRLGDKCLKKL